EKSFNLFLAGVQTQSINHGSDVITASTCAHLSQIDHEPAHTSMVKSNVYLAVTISQDGRHIFLSRADILDYNYFVDIMTIRFPSITREGMVVQTKDLSQFFLNTGGESPPPLRWQFKCSLAVIDVVQRDHKSLRMCDYFSPGKDASVTPAIAVMGSNVFSDWAACTFVFIDMTWPYSVASQLAYSCRTAAPDAASCRAMGVSDRNATVIAAFASFLRVLLGFFTPQVLATIAAAILLLSFVGIL
ncbi:hypothetical protein EV421DRAFT_1948161, partial [Armillaria borealis]